MKSAIKENPDFTALCTVKTRPLDSRRESRICSGLMGFIFYADRDFKNGR